MSKTYTWQAHFKSNIHLFFVFVWQLISILLCGLSLKHQFFLSSSIKTSMHILRGKIFVFRYVFWYWKQSYIECKIKANLIYASKYEWHIKIWSTVYYWYYHSIQFNVHIDITVIKFVGLKINISIEIQFFQHFVSKLMHKPISRSIACLWMANTSVETL